MYRGYGDYRRVSRAAPNKVVVVKRAPAKKKQPMSASRYNKQAALVGGLLGGKFGGPIGAGLGSLAGGLSADLVKQYTGFGDYSVKHNVLLSDVQSGSPPSIVNSAGLPGGGTRIRFREYLADIISHATANTFKLDSFPINVSNESTFPWLSQIASNYQEWNPRGIMFEFRSMSADALNSVNTALGQVIMATQYNAALENYQSKPEMENSEFSKSIKPSDSCLHMIECAKQSSVLSNLYTSNTLSDDPRFSILGNFQIASNGCQGTSVNLGELWITYEIDLLKPKLYDTLGEGNGLLIINLDNASVTGAAPLGTLGTATLNAASNLECIALTATVFTLPYSAVEKTYLYEYYIVGASTASLNIPGHTLAGGASFAPLLFEGSAAVQLASGYTNTTLLYTVYITVAGGSHAATITYGVAGTLPGTVTRSQIHLIEIPNSAESTTDTLDFLSAQ